MSSVRVRVDTEDSVIGISRWAIESLLDPLGLEAEWVGSESAADIYYGKDPDSAGGAVILDSAASVADVYGRRRPIEDGQVSWFEHAGHQWPAFFWSTSGRPDLVASTWFLLSGWQEVTTRARDHKGRFRYRDSLQSRFGFTTQPPVDAYREWLSEELAKSGYRINRRLWGPSGWALVPTIDVDYMRKWRKGMVYREVVNNLVLGRGGGHSRGRFRRSADFVRDFLRPGDTYRNSLAKIIDFVHRSGGTATVFFKAGAHGPHDVDYRIDGSACRRFLSSITQMGFEIGLHPSYYASSHPEYMAREVTRLSGVAGAGLRSIRQHYLRYEHPVTLRLHQENGFEIDSTLGFAEHEGFRRGTCVPFRVYDVFADRPSSVWEMPLAVMDGTLFNRRFLSPPEAVSASEEIMRTCRRFGGCAVMLWHNVVYDELDAPGWSIQFEQTIARAIEKGATVASLSQAFDTWRQSE